MKIIQKRKMNKKAIADVLVSFYSAVFIVIVLLIFLFLFALNKSNLEYDLEPHSQVIGANTFLTNYVKSPVIIDGQSASMADLINLAAKNETYESQLKLETQKLLYLFAEQSCIPWYFSVISHGLSDQLSFNYNVEPICRKTVEQEGIAAQIIVPLEHPEQYVVVGVSQSLSHAEQTMKLKSEGGIY